MSNKKAILKKIKNLLDLAEDKNSLSEAETAAKMAQKLILKYNIEEAEIHGGGTASMDKVTFDTEKENLHKHFEGKWLRDLFYVVGKFNFVKIVYSTKSTSSADLLYLLGTEENIEMVKYLCVQLIHRLRSIYKKEWSNYQGSESRGRFARSFFKGAVSGLRMKLESEQREARESDKKTAIVISNHNEALEKFTNKMFGNLGKGRSGRHSSREGYRAGINAGRNMDIRGAVNSSNGTKKLK